MESIPQQLGGVISLLLGLMGVIAPTAVEKFVSIQAVGKHGVAEIRATYGGFFLGLSAFALLSQQATAFTALGFAWLGAAFVRLGTYVTGNSNPKNAAGIVFEAVIGALCLSSYW